MYIFLMGLAVAEAQHYVLPDGGLAVPSGFLLGKEYCNGSFVARNDGVIGCSDPTYGYYCYYEQPAHNFVPHYVSTPSTYRPNDVWCGNGGGAPYNQNAYFGMSDYSAAIHGGELAFCMNAAKTLLYSVYFKPSSGNGTHPSCSSTFDSSSISGCESYDGVRYKACAHVESLNPVQKKTEELSKTDIGLIVGFSVFFGSIIVIGIGYVIVHGWRKTYDDLQEAI